MLDLLTPAPDLTPPQTHRFEIIALPASLFPSWNPAPFNSDTAASKFFVGPKSALPRLYQPGGLQAARSAFGPYWIVAVGECEL